MELREDSVKKDNAILKGDEIDLMALFRVIWGGRKLILYSLLGCLFIGIIIAFVSPKKYTVTATLLPASEKKSGNLGGLSALAGMAGINIGGLLGDASGIPAELYPQVVSSVPYLLELMNEKLTWENGREISLYEKLKGDTVPSAFSKIKKYTVGLPWTIKDAIFSSKQEVASSKASENIDIYMLDNVQRGAISMLSGALMITLDKKSGLVTLSVTMGEPLATAQLTKKAIDLLQKQIIDYRTRQSAENLKFIQERYAEAKINYEQSQRSLFEYRDTHRNVVAERMDLEYQRLSDAYDISSAIYKGLAQQQEQAKITVKEETPVFKVLDPVVVPKDKSAPKKGMIVAMSLFLGLAGGIGWIFGYMFFVRMRESGN